LSATAARLLSAAALALAWSPAFADGAPVLEPVPITGAYIARQAADRNHVSIIEMAGNYNRNLDGGALNIEPRAVIAREFLRAHPDQYDFIVVFSGFEFDTGEARALHWGVQNKVKGIGLPEYDNAALFGSQGRLQGYIDMAALTRYVTDPLNPKFETVLSVLAHEVLHQWAAQVRFRDADGSLSDALLGRDGAHWSFLLNSNASVEYGNLWKDNGDGTFTSTGAQKFFSPLDLYLMGFYKPEEVPPFFLIENPDIDKTRLPQENVTITGTKRWVTIGDILAAEGPRKPAAESAQKEFRLGFVFLTGPDQPVTDAQITALNHIRTAFTTRFAVLTGGRAVAQIFPEAMPQIGTGAPDPVMGGDLRTDPASLDAALAWLRGQQRPEGHWLDKDTTDVRDTTIALQALVKLDPAFTGAASTLAWLAQNPSRSSSTDYLARYARALAELGGDASALRTQLLGRQNADGGFGITSGYQSDPLDTALAILALAGSPEGTATVLDKAAQYLLARQNNDGGFSPAEGGPSRSSVTVAVMDALKAVNKHPTVAPAALAFLIGKQNPDGGFGDSPSTIHDTANVLQTFMAFDALAQIRPDDAAGYLLGRQTVSGSWDGSVYATASALAALKRFSFPNWALTSIAVEPVTPKDGDRVEVTIRLRNDANVVAPTGVLRIYDGDPAQGGVPIGADFTVPVMPPGAELVFTSFWDTFDKPGAHALHAVVDPDSAQTEMSERDNRGSVSVTVQPAPSGIDLTPAIAVTPTQPNRLPTTLSISVGVRNLGLTDVHNARVVVWEGQPGQGTMVGETTVDVLSRSTVVANFTYVLTHSGSVVFTAQVDPDGAIVEASETNNTISAEIHTVPSVDLVVRNADITVDKNPAAVGSDITFRVALRNEGTADAPSTDVRYFVTDGNTTRELRTNSIQLGAGQSTEQTLTWRVDLSGNLTFTAQIDPDGLVPELDDANNVATMALSAGNPSGPNLAVSYEDFTFAPNPGREGYPLTLSALVRNTGTAAANDAEIAFYDGDPTTGGALIGTQVIPSLAPGASLMAQFTWLAVPDTSDKVLFVVADPANAIGEFLEDDNFAFNVLSVLSLPDLAISAGDIQLTPAFPKSGDTVLVSVRIANLGAQEAENVLVRAFEGDPAAGGTPIGEQVLTRVEGFGAAIAAFNWTPAGSAIARSVVVQVDPASAVLERTKSNNNARRDVSIQDADLHITQKYFSPNGDGVKDATQLFFRVQNAGTVSVEVINKRDKVVRRFSVAATNDTSGGSVVWDGLDDLGRLVADGPYRLRVIESSGATFGEIIVHLDTNRSSLLEAAGTKFESYTNLSCELPDFAGFSMTSDDSKVFFTIPASAPDVAYPKGVYRMEGDGTDIRAIVPQTWFPTNVAPSNILSAGDGSRVVFTRNDVPSTYWAADGDGRKLSALNYTPPSSGQGLPWHISNDGATVYVLEYNSQASLTRLLALADGGAGEARTLLSATGAPQLSAGGGQAGSNEIEPNHPIASAQRVAPVDGEVSISAVLGNISGSTVYDLDFYTFFGQEGDLITADIDGGMNGARGVDTMLAIFGPGPTYPVLISNDDAYPIDEGSVHSYDARITNFRLPATGYYTVGVTNYPRYFGNGGTVSNPTSIRNGDYTLIISGISGAPSGSSAFSPDDSRAAILTQGSSSGWVLWLVDLRAGSAINPLGEGAEIHGFVETRWSPNSQRLAVTDPENRRIVVLDRNGNLVRTFAVPGLDDSSLALNLRNLEWSSSGSEFALRAYVDASSSADRGGLFVADLATGNVERVAEFRTSTDEEGFDPWGSLYWVPGERSLLYREGYRPADTAILLDEENREKALFEDWAGDFTNFFFSPTGRQALFSSDRAADDPTSVCYQQGQNDHWSFKSLLNLTADLRAIRSAKAGGIQLKGTAADANFFSYRLDYAPVSAPNDWHPIAPAAGDMVVDTLFTTWVPPAIGNYFARLSVEDLAGNVRRTIKRVSWSDAPSITDVYRTPALISPNGDGVNDDALIHYRVLEPVHLTFEFFDESGARVRAISRDHSSVGVEVELLWDGRDDNGLPVPDGRYRMTVQNYEFFVTVDNTPPEAFIELRDAYQPRLAPDPKNPTGPKRAIVAVDPAVLWRASDEHLLSDVLESGVGVEPVEWSELTSAAGCTTYESLGPDGPVCTAVPLGEFTGHRFRVDAADSAGNRTVSATALPAEQLIAHGFGNHARAECHDITGTDCSVADPASLYQRLGAVPYVPMLDTDGGQEPLAVALGAVRFNIAETISGSLAQVFVQFRPATDPTWREAPVAEIMTRARAFQAGDELVSIASPVDHVFSVTWDMAGVEGGTPYIVRLHAVDATGRDRYSNAFRFATDGLVFLGRDSSSIPVEIRTRLLNANPPEQGDILLWGREFVGEPLKTVHLFISSKDDPRFATAREIGVVAYPDAAFLFHTGELVSCKTYEGYLEARTEPRFDPITGAMVSRTMRTPPRHISLPCLELRTKTEPVPAEACDAPSKQQVIVRFAPAALDGKQLKLLTLSRTLPDGGGEDVVFNVNDPRSVSMPKPPAEPAYIYQYTLNTGDLPEGALTFDAKLLNVEDEEISVPVVVTIDHTPPVARLTYPLEGQRLCGVPRQMPDGTIRNTLTFEGELIDAGGLDYSLYLGSGTSPETFDKFHDSRTLDSFRTPSAISPPNPAFRLSNVAGPIGQIFDRNGEFTVRLEAADVGGFKRCEASTFHFDGSVEGARTTLDRRLFSPNEDEQFDEVVVSYGADETVTVSIDVHRATVDASGRYSVVGDSIRSLLSRATMLSGDSQLSWDGRDAAGGVVADGWYGIVVALTDACGNKRMFQRFTQVDLTPPVVTIAYPQTSDRLPLIVEVQGSVNDPHLVGYGVEVGVGSFPEAWIRLASRTGNTQGVQVLAAWNTYGLEGPYAVRVVATDAVGNERSVEVPVNLDERTELISYLEAVPELFSPNADGKLETTGIRFGLEENALVTLAVLDAGGTVKRTLYDERSLNVGPVSLSWDGKDDEGEALPDGRYTVGLLVASAANPLLRQEEKVTVVLDATAPRIDITRPDSGFLSSNGGVVGTIQDANIAEYEVAITDTPASPAWEVIDSGTTNRSNAVLATLQDREEGEYAVKVEASDLGEIVTTRIIPFIIDNTAPKVSLTAPERNGIVGRNTSPVNIAGTIEESYLANYALNVGNGEAPATWTELTAGTTLPLPSVLHAWDVSAMADGVHTLQLRAEDKAGNVGESRITVLVDNTSPTAAIVVPANGSYVTTPVEVRGSATDDNFVEYRLEAAPGEAGEASRWAEISVGTQPVTDGTLFSWEALPPDGRYALRLTVKDKADNVSEALVQVTVDTHPPLAPVNLKAALEDRNNVQLTWTANAEQDLSGYAVYRDGVRITPDLVSETTYFDANLAEGRYVYAVRAFDLAGWESELSNEAVVVLDSTPPTTRISLPSTGSTVSGLLDVKGSAYSVDDFKEYRLYIGPGAAPADYQLMRRSPVPVLADVVSEWNTLILEEGAEFTLKLEAEDINGNIGVDQITVKVDNLPPAAPTGLVATPSGANVQLTWNANTEPDLLGYLVFRDERLANLDGVLVGSLKPYAVVNTSYADLSLPDGPYTYYLIAIDNAGNISDPSAAVEINIDTRAPHVTMEQPAANTRFDRPLYVLGTSPDTDIATVRFQYRALGAATWVDLGEADAALPYDTTFGPAALGLDYGFYQLQAIATDLGGRVDPAPVSITVQYADVTPPAATLGLTSAVDGGDVTLTWAANTDVDLAGYHVDRRNALGATIRLTSTPVTQTAYTDSGVADGEYAYTVSAADTGGNDAIPSAESEAVVYTPVLDQPFTPTREAAIALIGRGVGPATVSGEVVNGAGTSALAPVAADAEGSFAAPIELAPGVNTVTVRLADAAGNVSKPTDVAVESGAAPSKPTGLAATVSGFDVALSWNANPETDVIGYRVFRGGVSLLPDAPVTSLTASASSQSSYYYTPASYAIDFNSSTYWSPATSAAQPAAGQWLAVQWAQPEIITHVTVRWSHLNYRAVDFDLEAWTGALWLKVGEVRANDAIESTTNLSQPYRTSRLRLVLRRINNTDSTYRAVRLAEFGVFGQSLAASTAFDDIASDGRHEYTASAVNAYGFESEPSDPAAVSVGDVTAPDPVTLSASVAGADVALTWTASTAADVARYTIYRDGTLIATHTDLTTLQYTDTKRPNGTYIYTVKAIDNLNNESEPSNEAPATVAVEPPPAPVDLAVTAVSTGGALDLAWAPAGGVDPASYRIFRATVAGGPYEVVGQSAAAEIRDAGLTNGITYFYVVAALDALDNVSTVSNEAAGTPLDQAAPGVALHYPTSPGHLLVTGERFTTLAGRSEAGAAITFYRNGIAAGQASASGAASTSSAQTTLSAVHAPLSPNGRYLAVHASGSISLRDFNTGVETKIADHNYSGHPALNWSPDGKRLLFVEYDSVLNRNTIRAYHLSDNSVEPVIDPLSFETVYAGILSSDGRKAVVLGYLGGVHGLWTYDLTAKSKQLLRQIYFGDIDIGSLRWSPDGRRLSYLRLSPTRVVEIVDIGAGSLRTLNNQVGYGWPAWSADGTELLYTAMQDSVEQVWRYRPVDDTTAVLTQGPLAHVGPQWVPDDTGFTTVEDNTRVIFRNRATGEQTTFLEEAGLNGKYAEWVASGYLAVRNATGVVRLAPAGRFELRGVELFSGDNVFTVIARDASGNASAPSQPIVINYGIDDRPDFALGASSITVLPSPTVVGETARIGIALRNDGSLTSPMSKLTLMVIDAAGEGRLLLEDAPIAAIQPGGSLTLSADWAPAIAGAHTVVATVDPMNEVLEISESNNVALREVIATGVAAPVLAVTLDGSVVGPNENLTGSVTLSNSGDTVTGSLVIAVEDEAGYPVQVLSTNPVMVIYGQTQTVPVAWPTGSTFSGAYRVSAKLIDAQGTLLAQDSDSFTLTGASDFTAQITTDRATYGAHADVLITGSALYQSGNAVVSQANLRLTVHDAQGQVLAEKTEILGDLLPGADGTLTLTWNTGLAVGLYTAQLTVRTGETALAQAQSAFSVESSGPQIKGTLLLSDDAPAPGTVQRATYALENAGNGPASGQPIRVTLVDARGQVLAVESHILDLAPGARDADSVTFATTDLALARYQVQLEAEVVGAPGTYATLATAAFTLVDRTAPVLALTAPTDNGYFAGSSPAIAFAHDELSSIQRVEIRLDGGDWLPAPVHNAMQSLYAALLPSVPEGTHTVEARAVDVYGNTGTAGPVTFIVDSTAPQITITGVANDGLYNHDATANVSITDTHLTESRVALNGTPYAGTVITQEGSYQLAAQARDAAGNTSQASLWFMIDKTAPAISVTGVEEGGLYNEPVTPVVTISDPHLVHEQLTLNDEPYASGTPVTADGRYTLTARGEDGATNAATVTVSFEIDATPPSPPMVTHPGEDETVHERVIDIIGLSEPQATVYLVLGGSEVAVFTDAEGAFRFPLVSFAEGANSFMVYAKDRAGNTSAPTTVRFNVVTAELTGSVRAPAGVLAFLPAADPADDAPLRTLVDATLTESETDYLVVHDETTFLTALRTNRYATVLLAELHPGCAAPTPAACGGQRPHLKLSLAAEQELRASIAAGIGLVWIKPDSDANERFSDVLGAKPRGLLPAPTTLKLEASPASDAGQWPLTGVAALRAQPEGGRAVGEIAPYDAPALILHTYGAGPVALVVFDPTALADQGAAQVLLARLLAFAMPAERALLPGGLAEVDFRATRLRPPVNVRFDETLAVPLTFVTAFEGSINGPTTATWARALTSSETAFTALVRLPVLAGEYAVTGALYEQEGDTLIPLKTHTLAVTLVLERDMLAASAMEALTTLAVAPQYEQKRDQAISLVHAAMLLPPTGVADAIGLLLDAVSKLKAIPGSAQSIGAIGRLLRVYQLAWIEN
jgi:subtilase family serine protease/Tol biopolymer transport system component/uncharacterized protein YfaP (DUF2135 family)